jgi:hypothetical protein
VGQPRFLNKWWPASVPRGQQARQVISLPRLFRHHHAVGFEQIRSASAVLPPRASDWMCLNGPQLHISRGGQRIGAAGAPSIISRQHPDYTREGVS